MNNPNTRPSGRNHDEMRTVSITRQFTNHAEGSVLICFGETRVLCNTTVEDRVPHFLRNSKRGWVTAEYGMLPRSTNERMGREAARGKQSGRTQEIQRLIGRSLRAAVDMTKLGERTITVDCDVIQADGGTRTASITGAYVALVDAIRWMQRNKMITADPIKRAVASVSIGVVEGAVVTDLDYAEDSTAETDMNVVMDNNGSFIEVQGTAEGQPFSREELDAMLDQAASATQHLFSKQSESLAT